MADAHRVKVIPKKGGRFVVGETPKKPTKKKTTEKPVDEDKENADKS